MGRRVGAAIVVVMGAGACAPPPVAVEPPSRELYPAPVPWWPRSVAAGVIGGGPVAIALHGTAIVAGEGVTVAPLGMMELVGSADGDGAAEAALSGRGEKELAVELIDVDAGVVRWRNGAAGAPAVAIAGDVVFAASVARVIVLDRASGTERARFEARWRGLGQRAGDAGDVVAALQIGGVGGVGEAGGDRGADATIAIWRRHVLGPERVLPEGAIPEAIVAVCDDAGKTWLAAWREGRMERWDDDGARYVVTWATAVPQPARLDCTAAPVVVSGGAPRAVRAIDPARGAIVGGPIVAADFWPARAGRGAIELATAEGIEARDRALGAPARGERLIVEQVLAVRGSRRLVRGADAGPWLLDERGAWPLAEPAGDPMIVAGERAFVTGPWRWPLVTQAPQPARYEWPDPPASETGARRPEPIARLAAPLLGDPPRADVPERQALGEGVRAEAGKWAVGSVAFDPVDPERMYVVVLEARPSADRGAGIAAFDLHVDRFRWIAEDACPPGQPVAIAVVGEVVVCGARGSQAGQGGVRASRTSDGQVLWTWTGATVDAVVGAGDAIAIAVGAETVIVDATTGAERGRWRSSDGFLPRVAVIRAGDATRIAVLEQGAIAMRSAAAGFLPQGAVAVGGRVVAVFAAGDDVAVTLQDGSLYLVGARRSAGVLAQAWHARGDLVLGFGENGLGDAIVVGVDGQGVPRLAAALAGVQLQGVGARAPVAGAPVALSAIDGRVIVLDAEGRARARVDLVDLAAPTLFSTVADGAPVAGVILAKPLRVVRFTL